MSNPTTTEYKGFRISPLANHGGFRYYVSADLRTGLNVEDNYEGAQRVADHFDSEDRLIGDYELDCEYSRAFFNVKTKALAKIIIEAIISLTEVADEDSQDILTTSLSRLAESGPSDTRTEYFGAVIDTKGNTIYTVHDDRREAFLYSIQKAIDAGITRGGEFRVDVEVVERKRTVNL